MPATRLTSSGSDALFSYRFATAPPKQPQMLLFSSIQLEKKALEYSRSYSQYCIRLTNTLPSHADQRGLAKFGRDHRRFSGAMKAPPTPDRPDHRLRSRARMSRTR
jgi:hypothetical protein